MKKIETAKRIQPPKKNRLEAHEILQDFIRPMGFEGPFATHKRSSYTTFEYALHAYLIRLKKLFCFFFLGTQITLANPVCLIAYVWASWRFFNDRIRDEEITLIYFFGDDYMAYQKKVATVGVPFVKGFDFTQEMKHDS